MTFCPWSQVGVVSVEDLQDLDADDFEMLKKEIKKIQYKSLLEGMTQRGFTNVPSVPTCPPHPAHHTARLKCPDPNNPPSRLLLKRRLNVSRSTLARVQLQQHRGTCSMSKGGPPLPFAVRAGPQ